MIDKLRDFDYTKDRLIEADMDKRDRSYIIMMQKKLNEVIALVDSEITLRKQRDKRLEKPKVIEDNPRLSPKKKEIEDESD